jgi:phosphatidylglycerol lysyltransferase
MAVLMVLGGVVLLISGATPPEHGRMTSLRHILPLPMVEASHFFASVVGITLVLVGRAVQRRVDSAYWVALALLSFGAVFSLMKGIDYEEAAVLAVLFAALAPWRAEFYRRGSLFEPRLGVTWLAAILAILLSVGGLAYFAHRHVEYSSQLWWQFTFDASAPRVLRGLVGVGIVVAVFSVEHLLRPAPARVVVPGNGINPDVERLTAQSARTYAFLAFLGDKRFLLDRNAAGFIMYNVSGTCAVAMGDPVGDERILPDLAWDYLELCDRLGVMPVLYEVGPEYLHVYADLGLIPFKFGEEAVVDLKEFTMDGASRKSARHELNKLEKEGVELAIEPLERIPSLLPELKAVSDDWLLHKHTREKGFSLGFFDEKYLSRFRHAVVRRQGRILAFANLLEGAGQHELSVDLMRHVEDAPHGIMDFIFFRLMLWGREEGYARFNLGLAPLSGIEGGRMMPLWNRLATLTFQHAEWFYNLQGLRQYKEKFDPQWRPSYIAAPGHIAALPRALRSIAGLVNRGMTGIIKR